MPRAAALSSWNSLQWRHRIRLLSGEEMTAQKPYWLGSGGGLAVRSHHFACSLRGGPRIQERRAAHQVVGNDPEADPSGRAVRPVISTAPQAMSPFDHTDAAFAADAPALATAKPSLPF